MSRMHVSDQDEITDLQLLHNPNKNKILKISETEQPLIFNFDPLFKNTTPEPYFKTTTLHCTTSNIKIKDANPINIAQETTMDLIHPETASNLYLPDNHK